MQGEGLVKPPEKSHNIGYDTFIQYYTDDKNNIVGLIEWHREPPSNNFFGGSVLFDLPEAQRFRTKKADGSLTAVWQVRRNGPLTLTPSISCGDCGHHGYIREGRWVPVPA